MKHSVNRSNVPKSDLPEVITTSSLNEDILLALFECHTCAIRIPNFSTNTISEKLGNWFLNNDFLEDYKHEVYIDDQIKVLHYGVQRVGIPYNTTYGQPLNNEIYQKYYNEAIRSIRQVREACFPYLSPIDKLRLELDEIWRKGANVASFEGKKMFVGIGRVTECSKKILEQQPHFDSLPPTDEIDGQFSANIYLKVPESGGELEVWNYPPLLPSEIINCELDKDWRSELPTSFLIAPQVGELVLINTRRPHAVRKFDQGSRVSIQCFIGYKYEEPLHLWC